MSFVSFFGLKDASGEGFFRTFETSKPRNENRDFVVWNSAALPALRAAATGANGASIFSAGGRGLAGWKPSNFLSKDAKANPTAAVASSEASAVAALSALPPAPARPLLFVSSDGVIKGALLRKNGKRSKTLTGIFDQILGSLGVPCVALLISSTTKEEGWEVLSRLATDVGLPAPDVSKSTFVAGAVGKNHFGPVGEHGESLRFFFGARFFFAFDKN